MKLYELAFACFIYSNFSDYDKSYLEFLRKVQHQPDLLNRRHLDSLVIWLNKWGCRQFAVKDYGLACSEISTWYKQFAGLLCDSKKNLWDLQDTELTTVANAYEVLSCKKASFRKGKKGRFCVSVGPTGASKILFALRQNALIPWDDPIREYYNYDGSGASYSAYLNKVKGLIIELSVECEKNGFALEQLPAQLGRKTSSVIKLIDEYHWITITSGWQMPEIGVFKKWARWVNTLDGAEKM